MCLFSYCIRGRMHNAIGAMQNKTINSPRGTTYMPIFLKKKKNFKYVMATFFLHVIIYKQLY